MSVDGRIIADVQRLRQLDGASLFLLVTGGKGAGKTTTLRAVAEGLRAVGAAAEAETLADVFRLPDATEPAPSTFTVCRVTYLALSQASARGGGAVSAAATARSSTVLVVDDVDLLWSLCSANQMLGHLRRVLAAVLAGPACAVVASAMSLEAVPPWLTEKKLPVTYALRELTGASMRRLLRAVPDPRFKVHGETLTETQPLSTSRTLLLFNACMTLHAAARGESREALRTDGAKNCAFLHHQRPPLESARHPLSPLYGLEEVCHRLRTLLSVFVSHSSVGGGGRLMASLPSSTGVLLHGPSGCGKSRLTQQLAADFPAVPFFFVECTRLFSKYLGESEEQLREVYRRARSRAPAVVVLEDIDVVAQSRGAMTRDDSGSSGGGGKGGLDVTRRMLAGLLCELDGVMDNSGVLTIGVTNAPGVLDAAVLRQGRLETILFVPPLTHSGAEAMCRDFFACFRGADEERRQCVATVAARAAGCSAASLHFFLRKVFERVVEGRGWPAAESSQLPLPPLSSLHGLLFEHTAMLSHAHISHFE